MISLCMIVKDEAKHLGTCLARAAGKVGEIVVADTGSGDNTKSIALGFTDKVYDYKWHADFAAARNFSVSKAENDWVLVLDADEYIEAFDREGMEDYVSDPDNVETVGRIKMVNLLGKTGEGNKYTDLVSRLFNKRYFQYEGAIHEQIVSRNGSGFKRAPVGITALHVGYSEETADMAGKLKRNLDMLTGAVAADPQEPYLRYQLGKTYYMMKDYGAAASHFEKALALSVDFGPEYSEDLVETYGYALINSGRYADAMRLEKYAGFYGGSADFNFLLGLVYMNNARLTKSVESFVKCTGLSGGRMEGVTSYLAYYNIGVIYEVLGFRDQAAGYYRMCGSYPQAVKRLEKL